MSGDEISERFIVGIESFVSLGSAFLRTVTGRHIPPLSSPAICHLYGSDTPITEFFLETNITTEDDVCVASDWLVLLIQFLVIHAFRCWSYSLVWEPGARKYLGEQRAKRVKKFSQALVQLTLHVMSAWFAWRILSPQPWLWSSNEWRPQEDPVVAPDLKFYCLFYAARLLSDMLSLKNQTHVWEYAVHYLLSVALLLRSAMVGYIRVSCVLMLFMDWVDPFLLASKMCRFLSAQPTNDGYQRMANRFYEVYAILFLLTRNLFSGYVVWTFITNFSDAPTSLKAISFGLMLLQTYWMVGIVQTVMNQHLGKGHEDDMESNDEDEQGHEEHKRMVLKTKGKRKKY